MNRKLFIALSLIASTAYVACGGGGEEGKGANDPSSSASVAATPTPAPTPTETATPAPSPSPVVSAEPPKPKSLYERLGGKDAIAKVVDASLKNITEDKRINKFFAKTVKDPKKVEALRANLIDQICAATGGPCEYKGKDMKTAHKGMKVKDADFAAFVEDVTKALDGAGVGKPEQEELLGALGGMKGDIVEEQPGKGSTGAGATGGKSPGAAGSAPAGAKSAAPAGGAKSAAPAASPKK
jgi:hemoglobin